MKFLDKTKRKQLLHERHSCKIFDTHYKLSSEELEEIAELARLSPSSYNTQPWHFIMVTNKELKKQIATHSYFNKDMIESASALMVVCSLEPSQLLPTSSYMQNLYVEPYKSRVIPSFAKMLDLSFNHSMQKLEQYMLEQCYIAVGQICMGVSLMGLDSCIIGGFDAKKVSEVLKEHTNKPKIACLIALGKRVNGVSLKSRKPKAATITWL
ncbi:NAD(P)H-dependent oxidoreductase [Helicobacter cetorum]|uniref:NAD(P)H-dependent nitroreductase n=1 Tax=Helicobacter cetorum (strain ATCC BAA-540 / CCUG 52418 / MIT 99-5656) TaxID=1163745 RepID=I0ETM8_HELCM|nr:NAD(P)H-dependent oxidoreductase [Helicobacter cetorum]AFI06297.1 NAD(P)H-dependent nitroreductase [Helicobacter cetorum MIT 99-5656]